MEKLVYFYPEGHAAHRTDGHPERPERIEFLRAALASAGWWQPYPKLEPAPLSAPLLEAIHNPAYLRQLETLGRTGGFLDGDTYLTPASWQLALNSARGALAVVQAVWQGEARHGFALCRPPGHHATRARGMGFCLLNNIALAAESLCREQGARRLAIIDLDLHHGNGTQDIFWQRGDVFFCSVHQSPLYPGSGGLYEIGAGPGKGTTANFPLPPRSGDQAYQAIMESLILPLLDRFEPEMILVSYGFDPHERDPLGELALSAAAFGRLIGRLSDWADERCAGRLALILEGGYDLQAGTACTLAVTAALLGEDFSDPLCGPLGPSRQPEPKGWQSMVAAAKQLWGV